MTTRPDARVRSALAVLAIALFAEFPLPAQEAGGPSPELARLRKHVFTLAGPDYEGRRGAGARKAGDYVLEHFKALKLEPLFGDEFTQPIPGPEGKGEIGRNVGAILRGVDPDLKDEWVIVSAHFDHLGTRGTTLYPGADDNASGVAMMLELARCFVEEPSKPARSVMFLGFDLEEIGLFGSRYFVEHSPVPLERVALFLTADMIGRSLGGIRGDRVFVMGTENAPGLRPWIESSAKGLPITPGLLGSDLLLLNRSDYGPFRARKVPYLFFSTGENPTYHAPSDLPETIDYPKLEAISRLIHQVARSAATEKSSPRWVSSSPPILEEAETIRGVFRTLLEHQETLKIGGAQALLMRNALRSLDGMIARGTITPEERTAVIRVARVILFSVF